MKISYSEYIKKADVSVLVAESIFTELLGFSDIVKVKDFAKTTSGGTPNRSNADFYNGEIPWLKSGELNDGIIHESEEFITEDGLNNSSAKLHPKGTLLIAMYGATAGKAGILNFEASTNQAVCAIYPNDKVERDYLFWFFRSHRFQYIEKSKGGAQPNISQSVIKETAIPVPDKNLQLTIAELLFQIEKDGTVDLESVPELFKDSVYKVLSFKNSGQNISTELTHQLDLVKQLRQAFLREAMQGKLVPQDINDEPASVLLEKIKVEKERLIKEKKIKKQKPLPPITEDEIPFEIPGNWVLTRVGEVCTKVTDGFHHTPKKLKEGKIYISATHIREYGIDWDNCQFIPEKEHDELFKKAYPQKGEILITNRGAGCATPAIIDIDDSFSFQNAALIGFNQSFMSNRFLFYFILKNRDDIMEYFVNGGLQPMLSNVVLSKIPLPLPPLSEQQRIVAKLDELMAYCDELETSIKESQQQNELLLQQVLREALEPKEKEVERV